MSAKKIEANEIIQDQESENSIPGTPQGASEGSTRKEAQVSSKNGNGNGTGRVAQSFDPAQYLSKFDGKDYLEVKWRIMWLRSEHPDARMTTEIVQHNEEAGFALFRAEVELPDGGRSTGWGSETVRDFHDYIEAAETKALGRALASLGYGTQFCQDFDFSANARPGTAQVVDAPVNLAAPRSIGSRSGSFGNGNGNSGSASRERTFANPGFHSAPVPANGGGRIAAVADDDDFDRLPPIEMSSPGTGGATEKQVKAIYAIGRASKRLSESQVDDRAVEVFGVRPGELTKAEASQFIDMLKGDVAA
ncbi:MAG TPA: hypothetical protein VJ183_06535 [Chloroflexia bacterium]|nr:hypothetical protein [Chloroflexia bacterium]